MAVPRSCSFVIPGDWHTPTGGYRYDRRIALALRDAGWQVGLCTLADGFPHPDRAALDDAARRIAELPDGTLAIADGLFFGVMPELARAHAARLRWLALVHHPLHLETGLDTLRSAALRDSERQALQSARVVVATSAATARDLDGLDVPHDRIRVVEPGTDAAPLAGGGQRRILCVATLTPRKAHAVLLEAFAGLPAPGWTLHCVGSATRDPACAQALRHASRRLGLDGRVFWHGEVDEPTLAAHYAAADLFVLPSFHEGYGMVVAEALARGLPVVAARGGALAQTLPPDAGLLVPPGDAGALREALARLTGDAAARERCAAGARAARARLGSWADAAARFARVLEAVR